MKKELLILASLMLLLPQALFAQSETESMQVEIYFDQGCHEIDLGFNTNKESLEQLTHFIELICSDPQYDITNISVNSFTSPEGGKTYNAKLSKRRSSSLYEYLKNSNVVPEGVLSQQYSGIDWDGLREQVEASDMQYKAEVLDILTNEPEETWARVNPNDRWLTLVDSRLKRLMELKAGKPYWVMYDSMFPQLRRGSVVSVDYRKVAPVLSRSMQLDNQQSVETSGDTSSILSVPTKEQLASTAPLFALKTNLLYDLATVLNVELEVPIGDRWSVAAEWMFPWWTTCNDITDPNSSRSTLQLLQGNLEAKYWFGDRSDRQVMTGWYAGLYGGTGKYDFEYNTKGYQGEFYVVGLSGGYAHTINKSGSLRMEYSLGLGYMQTDYRYYKEHFGINDEWHTLRQETGKQTWIGPTKAKISLVWMLNRKVNKSK